MKTLRNKTNRPLKVNLRGGKTLHLGPWKTGQVSDQAAEEASVRRMVDAGEVEIVGEEAGTEAGDGASSEVHESTHGHPQTNLVRPKGNR